jgi:hypothetical protein
MYGRGRQLHLDGGLDEWPTGPYHAALYARYVMH